MIMKVSTATGTV